MEAGRRLNGGWVEAGRTQGKDFTSQKDVCLYYSCTYGFNISRGTFNRQDLKIINILTIT